MSKRKPRTALVVSADFDRRADWSDDFQRDGFRVARCSGRNCPLLGGEPCALLGSADIAVYDEESVPPLVFLGLVRALPRPTILFARDEETGGRHHARFVRVLDHRGAATVFPHLR